VELGQAEVHEWGADGAFVVFGSLFPTAVKAAERLRQEGLDVGVINARFAKPLDRTTILRAVEELPLVVTVEEGTLEGGFGSAVLEAANAAGHPAANVLRLGLPDRFVEHAERGELLASLGLDVEGLCRAVRRSLARGEGAEQAVLTGD
jgi:1-deoxy-D-xylulose-5-phosphate synthase